MVAKGMRTDAIAEDLGIRTAQVQVPEAVVPAVLEILTETLSSTKR